jgi:hypothetical protein
MAWTRAILPPPLIPSSMPVDSANILQHLVSPPSCVVLTTRCACILLPQLEYSFQDDEPILLVPAHPLHSWPSSGVNLTMDSGHMSCCCCPQMYPAQICALTALVASTQDWGPPSPLHCERSRSHRSANNAPSAMVAQPRAAPYITKSDHQRPTRKTNQPSVDNPSL